MSSSRWLRLPRGVAFDDAELERSFCVHQWTGSYPTAVAALSIGLMLALMLSIVYSTLRGAFLIAAPFILMALVVRVRVGRHGTARLARNPMTCEGAQAMLDHGSDVASVCSGSLGDAHLVALVREEMKVRLVLLSCSAELR